MLNWNPTQIVLSISACMYSIAAFSETITLKNGSVIKGAIVHMSEIDLTVETADFGKLIINRRSVQSIQDGSTTREPTLEAPKEIQGPLTAQNDAAPSVPAVKSDASPPTTPSSPPISITAHSTSKPYLGGNISFASGILQVEAPSTHRTSQWQGVHWEPLAYGFSNGILLGISADFLQPVHHQDFIDSNHLYLGAGWSSKLPLDGERGSRISFKALVGGARFTYKDVPSDYLNRFWLGESYYEYSQETSQAFSAGMDIQYNYYTGSGLGVALGAISNRAEYGKKSRFKSEKVKITTMLAYAGASYRF